MKVFDLNVVDGALPDSGAPIRVDEGDQVTLIWTANRKTDIHFHGYDVKAILMPGEVTEMSFQATATGRFPITSHGAGGAHVTLQYVEVYPR